MSTPKKVYAEVGGGGWVAYGVGSSFSVACNRAFQVLRRGRSGILKNRRYINIYFKEISEATYLESLADIKRRQEERESEGCEEVDG